MFQLLKDITAKKIAVSNNKLAIIQDGLVLVYEGNKLIFRHELAGDFTTILYLPNDSFLIRRDDNTSLILKIVEGVYSLSSYLDAQPIDDIDEEGEYIISSKYLSYYPIELETKVIRTQDKKVVFTSGQLAHYRLIKGLLLSMEKDHLIVYDLHKGDIKSKLNLTPHLIDFTKSDKSSTKDQIQNYLGLNSNILWVALSSGKILAIDIDKGSLKYEIGFKQTYFFKNFSFEVKEGDYMPFGELMQLDEKKEELFGLRGSYFIKVDLSEPQLRRKYVDIAQSMEGHKIFSSYRNYTFPCDDQFIYFCDDRQGKIGVFDREKQEVVWSYELKIQGDGLSKILEMKCVNNRWYVLDLNNTLHVFERTL